MTQKTIEKAPREKRQSFATHRQATALPAGETAIDYPHTTQAGLICRVHPNGRRVLWHRWKLKVPDGMGALKLDEGRQELGELGKDKDPTPATLSVSQAVAMVLAKRAELSQAKRTGEGATTRLTVKAAWELYPTLSALHADATKIKADKIYERYYKWFESRFLDELPTSFWSTMLTKLEKGTLVPSLAGDKSVGTLGPLRVASRGGVINLGINLYEVAHQNRGLKGLHRSDNPAREAKANVLPAVNLRKHRIPLALLPKAWRAADQLISPWWRDLLYCYVLTGLRRNLMIEMRFSEIDWRQGTYIFPALRPGTKRRLAKEGEDADDLRLPLSKRVLAILAARRKFAPDPDGYVWFSPRPTRGKAAKKQVEQGRVARLTDARAAWSLITEQVGIRFTPQDLRRTFANVGASSDADVFAVSLLMLHSGQTLATDTGISSMTVGYFNTPEAQAKMRKGAEAVAAFVDSLLDMSEAKVAAVNDPNLPAELEELLRSEETETGESEERDEPGSEDSADYEAQ